MVLLCDFLGVIQIFWIADQSNDGSNVCLPVKFDWTNCFNCLILSEIIGKCETYCDIVFISEINASQFRTGNESGAVVFAAKLVVAVDLATVGTAGIAFVNAILFLPATSKGTAKSLYDSFAEK